MPFCRNCGAEVGEKAKFCPNCAAPQPLGGESPPSTSSGPASARPPKPKLPPRPLVQNLLSLFQFAVGGVLVVLGFFGALGLAWLGFIFLVLGVVSVAGGFTTWRANPAAEKMVLATAIGYMALGILLALTNSTASAVLGILGVVLGAYMVMWIRGKTGKKYIRPRQP